MKTKTRSRIEMEWKNSVESNKMDWKNSMESNEMDWSKNSKWNQKNRKIYREDCESVMKSSYVSFLVTMEIWKMDVESKTEIIHQAPTILHICLLLLLPKDMKIILRNTVP